MLRLCGLLLVLVMSSLHAAEAPVEVAGAMTVNSAQAKRLHELGAVFVDVRPTRQWSWGHVWGAVHLDLAGNFAEMGNQAWPRQVPLVVYCDSEVCPRSAVAAQMLVSWGYTQVYYYREGFFAWQLLDMPQGRGLKGEQVAFRSLAAPAVAGLE